MNKRIFPVGCYIDNIRPGSDSRAGYVYATLRHPNGNMIIVATLEYINEQMQNSELVSVEKYDEIEKR